MTLRTAGKKGLLPGDPTKPRINLGAALSGTEPTQAHWGHVPVIGMLGNDVWGDCFPAACAHWAETLSFYAQGSETEITLDQTLAFYSAVAGFNINAGPPGSNPTDTGSDMQTGLQKLISVGVGGITATVFGDLEVANTSQWQQGLAQLGPLLLGVGVSDADVTAFNNGQVWTPGTSQNAEDHCVLLTGYQPGMYWCQTWGGIQGITPAWFAQNVYEIWGAISPLWVNRQTGFDPDHVNLAQLGEQFAALTGQPSPFSG